MLLLKGKRALHQNKTICSENAKSLPHFIILHFSRTIKIKGL